MKTTTNPKPRLSTGMYLLENLTSGMYNEPLTIYREYIQNAVDSIDLSNQGSHRELRRVEIDIDPAEKRLRIFDNGSGISAEASRQILCSIGRSNKVVDGLRGFRGIGRLGGIAFADKVVFKTKVKGEHIESVQEWDCKRLRQFFSDISKRNTSLEKIFKSITTFSQQNSKSAKGSYFEVNLYGVSSFRNYLLDIQRVRNYLQQIAPVPFDHESFSYGKSITSYLKKYVDSFEEYNIALNGEPIYKPYKNFVRITKKNKLDYIDRIERFSLRSDDGNTIAHGWYGVRRDLLGSIMKGDDTRAICVRVGNILLGDKHLLDKCFREDRFNGYLVGEVHVSSDRLIPNSRRDDFIDNKEKASFYNSFEREIGIPLSKEIRLRSNISTGIFSQAKLKRTNSNLIPVKVAQSYETQEGRSVSASNVSKNAVIKKIIQTCKVCNKLSSLLSIMGNPEGR